jgi:Trypsin-like peptidase domain
MTRPRLATAVLSTVLLVAGFSLRAESLDREKAGVVRVTSSVDGKRKTGTGFIVRLEPDVAYILTASHVVEGDNHPEIEFFTRRNLTSRADTTRIEGDDPRGLALLLVRGGGNLPAGLTALPLATGSSLSGGEEVTAIGFPQGGGPWAIVRANVVSRVGRDLTLGGSIDEGNSGGPILMDGSVVGVVMGVDGKFGRAIPAAIARLVLDGWGLQAGQSAQRPTPPNSSTEQPAAPAASLEKGAVKVEKASCEKLRGGTTYRIWIRGHANGPAGALLRASLLRDGKTVSTPKPSCDDWKTCQRAQGEPDSTAWTISTMFVGPPPGQAVLSLDPQPSGTPQPTYTAERVELRCYF